MAVPEDGSGEAFERRGVRNPRIVDLITPDRGRGEVVLAILEDRPWSGGAAQLGEHEDKLNSYFGYVLDGHLAREYPDYAGLVARVELRCVEEPGEEQRAFLAAAARFAEAHGLRFVVRIDPDPFAVAAPWE